MPKCTRCGRKGFFLKLTNGLCANCTSTVRMEQEQAEKLITYQAKGYGLKNVNDRMCILYGEDYAIRILSKVGQGTRVDMRIPKEVKKDET